MTQTGQKSARALFDHNLAGAQAALRAEKMPNPPFQGALAELFVTHRMGWDCVSGPENDKFDALCDGVQIEIKSSTNGRKPSAKDKDYDEFCWLKLDRRGAKIWATRLTVAPKGGSHTVDLLGEQVCIFDAELACRSNDWLKEAAFT